MLIFRVSRAKGPFAPVGAPSRARPRRWRRSRRPEHFAPLPGDAFCEIRDSEMPAKLEPDHRMTEGATPKSPSASAERHRAGKFSIKAKLQAAFGVVALMTVIASAVAVLSFAAIQRS